MPSAELARLNAELFAELAANAQTTIDWAQMRREYLAVGDVYPVADGVAVEEIDAGGVPAVRYAGQGSDTTRAVLYFHGGGYCTGGIASHQALTSHLALAAGCPVVVLDYRLAPEHPFPAPVEDALSAWRWMLDGGLAPGRVAFAGDSAGGGLTIAAMLAAREAGLPLPAAGVPLSPWVDLTGEMGWRHVDDAIDPLVQHRYLDQMTAAYIADGDPRHPHAAPIHGNLSGLPPLLVQVGTLEVLLPDSLCLVEKARAAGVEVTLEIEEDAPHVWHHFVPRLAEAVASIERIGAFVRDRTA